jgi:hypothetical protein
VHHLVHYHLILSAVSSGILTPETYTDIPEILTFWDEWITEDEMSLDNILTSGGTSWMLLPLCHNLLQNATVNMWTKTEPDLWLSFPSFWSLAWLFLWPWRWRADIPQCYRSLHNHCCENLASYSLLFCLRQHSLVCCQVKYITTVHHL